MAIKDSKYVKIKSVNSFYHIFGKVDGYFEEINGNKHLALVHTSRSKEIMKIYEKLWSKMRDLMRSINKNSNDHDEKLFFMKINIIHKFSFANVCINSSY